MFRVKKNFIKSARQIRLAAHERDAIRQNLVLHMNMVPRIQTEKATWHLFQLKPVMVAGLFLMLLGTGAGVSFAAETALPGDLLYPVKIHVTENIRSLAARNDASRAEWHVERIERRLEEAELLTAADKLDVKTSALLEQTFARQVTRVEDSIKHLETQTDYATAASMSSNYSAALRAHTTILSRLREKKDAESFVDTFIAKLQSEQSSNEETSASLNEAVAAGTQPMVQEAAEGKKRASIRKLTQAQDLFKESAEELDPELAPTIESRLGEAQDLAGDAEAELQTGSYGAAFDLYQEAHRAAQEANVLIHANKKLGKDRLLPRLQKKTDASDTATTTNPATSTAPSIERRQRNDSEDDDSD